MKNVNLNAVFGDIVPSNDNSRISLGNVVARKKVRITNDGTRRIVPQLPLTVFATATESKDQNIVDQLNPDIVFAFREDYVVRVRLTETYSGRFMDLGEFVLSPSSSHESEGLCRKTFHHIQLCLFEDIEFPEEQSNEKFVIKLVICRKAAIESGKYSWVVQAIYPIDIEKS